MPAPQLIVCEPQAHVTSALRRELVELGVDENQVRGRAAWLRQRPGLAPCGRLLREFPTSIVVLVADDAPLAETLAWLVQQRRNFPHARFAAIAQNPTVAAALREAGAIHVAHSSRQLRPLAALVLRHRESAPQPELPLLEETLATLPWQAYT